MQLPPFRMRIIDERASRCTETRELPGRWWQRDSADQHAVAVTVEPVARLYRMPVGAQKIFTAGQRRNQREQARFWQMEIGEELIHHANRFAGIQENFCFGPAFPNCNAATRRLFRGVLQRTNHSGPNHQDRTVRCLRSRNDLYRLFRNIVALGVDFVVFQPLGAHRLESTETHVQRNFGGLDFSLAQPREQFRREVKSRRGRRNGASLFGVNSLVAFSVSRLILALDIRRQWNMSEASERLVKS